MVTRRMMFKKLRKWFEPCFNEPLRLNAEQFKGLLLEMFGVDNYNDEEVAEVLKKLGFQERRNIKGTYYIRPTADFYKEADKRYLTNRISLLIHGCFNI
jgi:hypothetical protein